MSKARGGARSLKTTETAAPVMQRRSSKPDSCNDIKANRVAQPDAADDIAGCIDLLRSWQALNEWSLRDEIKRYGVAPNILDFVDSMLAVYTDSSLSVARLGDGELGLASGYTVPNNGCQPADKALQEALQRVLRCDRPECKIALPKAFFYSDPSCVSEETEKFSSTVFVQQFAAGKYADLIRGDYEYLDGSMSVVRKHYSSISRRVCRAYYSVFRRILEKRDVIVVSGDSRCFEFERNLLKDAGVVSTTFLAVPQQGAWAYYDQIKSRLLDMNGSGSRLVCLGCGPTATVLAYELSDKMRCLDMGHMFADYNLAMEGAEIGSFWA